MGRQAIFVVTKQAGVYAEGQLSCACSKMNGNLAAHGPFPVMVKQAHDTRLDHDPD